MRTHRLMGIFMTELLGIQENSNFELSIRSNMVQVGCHRGNRWEVADEVNRKQQSWLLMTCVWHESNLDVPIQIGRHSGRHSEYQFCSCDHSQCCTSLHNRALRWCFLYCTQRLHQLHSCQQCQFFHSLTNTRCFQSF